MSFYSELLYAWDFNPRIGHPPRAMDDLGKLDTSRSHASVASLLSKSSARSTLSKRSRRSRRSRQSSRSSARSSRKSGSKLPPLSDYGTPKRKPRKKKFIKDERLRRINQGDSKNFKTNAELLVLGAELLKACKECRTADVVKLLESEVDVDNLDHHHHFWSCAHWAAFHNDVTALEALYDAGANLEVKDRPDEWTPVTICAKYGHNQALRFLVSECGCNLHHQTRKGLTAFAWACGQGHLGTARMIAQLSEIEWQQRELAMTVASREDRVFLEKLPTLELDGEDATGITPLMEACAGGHLGTVRWLVHEKGADILKANFLGARPLDIVKRRKGLGKLKGETIAERQLLKDQEDELEGVVREMVAKAETEKERLADELRQKKRDAERARRIELGLEPDDENAIVDLETGEVVLKSDLDAKAAAEAAEAALKKANEEGAEDAYTFFHKLGLSEKDLGSFREVYDKIDDDGSEEITASELFMFLGIEATPFATRVFSMMDDSGDNSVDFEEFCSMLTLFCSISQTGFNAFAFSMYDSDGSQTLEMPELRNMMEEVYGPKWEEAQRTRDVLDAMDLDRDGVVDIGEFEAACRKHTYLIKPAWDMQQQLRDKTLGMKKWKRIAKNQAKLYDKDIKRMMEKITGRQALLEAREKENEELAEIMEQQLEEKAAEDRKQAKLEKDLIKFAVDQSGTG